MALKKWKRYIPIGSQDFLVDEMYNKKIVQDKLQKLFFLNAYQEVETPTLEYLDVFSGVKASIEQEQMMKLIDTDGRILVLRPDITIPIARIAATKLRNAKFPLRLSYNGNVYRNQREQEGMQTEIAQAGIELLGVEGPEGDAEVIALAIQSFLSIGIEEFQIDLGQVEFLKGLLEQTEIGDEWEEEIRYLIDQKNMLELELVLKESNLSDKLKNTIYNLPKLYGNGEMLKQAETMSKDKKCLGAIENIREVYKILRDYEFERFLTFDFGMVQSFNFYTGIIFRGMTAELGFPICGGGRYDKLVNEFGFDVPATGFAIGIKRALTVLERQKSLMPHPEVDVLVVYSSNSRFEAYSLGKKLREEGKRTELFPLRESQVDYFNYARDREIEKIILIRDQVQSEFSSQE